MGSGFSVEREDKDNSFKGAKYPGNLRSIRQNEFQRLKGHVYLDFTGSSIYSSRQMNEFKKDLDRNLYGNPHSANPSSNLMSNEVDQVREKVLRFFNVTSHEYSVVFTSGATASLRLVAECFNWSSNSMYAFLEDNHTSVVGVREMAAVHGTRSFCLRFPRGDFEDLSDIDKWKPVAISTSSKELQSYATNSTSHPNNRASETHNRNPSKKEPKAFNLFSFPAQSNFSGRKHPLTWIKQIQRSGIPALNAENKSSSNSWSVLLDAAAFVPSSPLDLREHSADFVCMSFYKMFGFPTGIGALLVKRGSRLTKDAFFGGGTTEVYLPSENFHVLKPKIHEKLEEGTIDFLNILALKYGFSTLERTTMSMKHIQLHTFSLIRRLHQGMIAMQHFNGQPVFRIYAFSDYDAPEKQGAVISFNAMRHDGSYVGYNEVIDLASKQNIHLRGGCFCNVGSCNTLLSIGDSRIKQIHKSGYKCGEVDLVDNLPVGAVRASLGHVSAAQDVKKFLHFLKSTFVTKLKKKRFGRKSKTTVIKVSPL